MDNNAVSIVGTIASEFEFSHTSHDENFYRVFLAIKRKSEMFDKVPLLISSKLFDVDSEYCGKKVYVIGEYRTFNHHTPEKTRLLSHVFVQNIGLQDSDSSLNEVYLEGHLCKDPTYRETPSGKQITDFILAVNRPYGKSDYIPCIAWGRNAIFVSNLKTGAKLRVYGRVQSREYSKLDKSHTAYEISATQIEKVENGGV